jgi:NAD(P)H dehydrogenase (quinone)
LQAEENRILFQKQLLPGEQAAKKSGMNYIIAGSPFFQENVLGAKDGLNYPLRDGALTFVSIYDIGRTLAVLLENPEPHYGKTYELTGPALATGKDIADAFSEVLGKSVSYKNISREEAKKMFMEYKMPEWQAEGAVELVEDYANRHYNVTDHILKITGKNPRTIKETIQNNFNKNQASE